MKDINAIMADINRNLNVVEKTLKKTKENYKKKLKDIFLNDFDAYYSYIEDEIKEEELNNEDNSNVNNNDDNNNNNNKSIKKKFKSILSKNKKKKENTNTNNKPNENEQNNDVKTDNNNNNNQNLVDKENITDLTNLLVDEEKVKKEIEEYEIDTTKEKFTNEIIKRFNDMFIPKMQAFYDESIINYEKLKSLLKEAVEDFTNLCISFCEDPESTEPSDLFTLFNDFWDQFQVIYI